MTFYFNSSENCW